MEAIPDPDRVGLRGRVQQVGEGEACRRELAAQVLTREPVDR